MNDIIRSQVRVGCEYYLGTLNDPKMTTLADIIEFNGANADEEFHDGTEYPIYCFKPELTLYSILSKSGRLA